MPGIPENITIAGRTPATIKGNLPPLIDTAEAARGGFRAGDDTGGDDTGGDDTGGGSDPVGEGIDPIDGYPNAWVTGSEPNWETRLARVGNGTADPTFNVDNAFTFLGAFKIPGFASPATPVVGSDTLACLTYKAPDGTNGANGSVFIAAWEFIAELQIPTLKTDASYASLNSAPLLQPFVRAMAKAPSANTNGINMIGWLRAIDGKLYMSTYANYTGGGNSQPMLIANDSSDLENGSWQGYLDHGQGDHGARYIMEIPPDRQTEFDGTYFIGICASINIIGRSSFGTSLIALTPSDITANDVSVSVTEWAYYSDTNAMPNFSPSNEAVSSYYGDLLFPENGYNMFDYYTAGETILTNWSTEPFDERSFDGSLAAYLGVPIGTNGRTRTTFDGIPLPDISLSNHTIQYTTKIGCALIPPGTDTVLFIGSNQGARYGNPYKTYNIEEGPSGGLDGGFGAASKTDYDNYVWMMNLNDVSNNVNPWDSDFYLAKPMNNLGPHINRSHVPIAGHFDSATNKLYIVSGGYGSGYGVNYIVSVFQVGSGI